MLRRWLLFGWLAQAAYAAPLPSLKSLEATEKPGYYASGRETAALFQRTEAFFRKRHDEKALLEIEALRLPALLHRHAAGSTERVQALRVAGARLPAGALRARVEWAAAALAQELGERQAMVRFAEQALDEPGVDDEQRAVWLLRLFEWSYGEATSAEQAALVARLSQLDRRQPGGVATWCLLKAQTIQASSAIDVTLVRSLVGSQVQLARAQGWRSREVEALLDLYGQGGRDPEERQRALRRCLELPRTEARDELLGGLLLLFRTTAEKMQIRRAMVRPEDTRWDDLWVGSDTPLPERLADAQRQATRAHRERRWDDEIRSRERLANVFNNLGRSAEQLEQQRAAVQLRLDHPADDPGWRYDDASAATLNQHLISTLWQKGRPREALALCQQTLEQSPQLAIDVRYQLERLASELSGRSGDGTAQAMHFQAALALVPQLPPYMQAQEFWALSLTAPPEQKLEVVRRGREQAQAYLRSAAQPVNRWMVLENLGSLLSAAGDRPGRVQLWRNELERARGSGDHGAEQRATFDLLSMFDRSQDATERAEVHRLLSGLLDDPTLEAGSRDRVLDYAYNLAVWHDPLGLSLAEEKLRLAKASGEPMKLAAALVRRAAVYGQFKRFAAALDDVGRAEKLYDQSPMQLKQAQDLRSELLWDSGKQQEALELRRAQVEAVLKSERSVSSTALETLSEWQRTLGQEWTGSWEAALQQRVDEEADSPGRRRLLARYLLQLASQRMWDRGRELLKGHPGSWPDEEAQKLRQVPQWADLLPPASGAALPAAPSELAGVVDSLRLSRPELGSLMTLRSTNLKHLQSRLGPHDTLVTYCCSGDQLYVLALRADRSWSQVSRLSDRDLRGLVSSYVQALGADRPSTAESSLFSALLEPVLDVQDPQARLLLVPTGELWQLPFGALRDGKGEAAAARAELVLLGSGDLLRLADAPWEPFRLSHPLALGAPPDAELPGAYAELGDVARQLPGCELRRGAEATVDTLSDPNQHWGLLHLASHARYLPDRPLESEIMLKGGSLRLRQVSQLSLSEHALVALSCCQGGAAPLQGTDEPVTLATGFSAAGAQTVIANLWRVDDAVAQSFFAVFYARLGTGASPGVAFRAAQEATRAAYPKARDWAGFFLLGNPT